MAGGIYGTQEQRTITPEEAAINAQAMETAVASASLTEKFTTALNVGWFEGLTSDTHEIIANRTPEQFVDAISVAVPQYAGAMEAIKTNPELLTNFHAAFGKDPSMVDGFIKSMGTSKANPEEMAAQLADPTNQERLSWLLGRIAQSPDDEADFEDFEHIALDKNVTTANKAQRMLELGYNPLAEMASGDWLKMFNEFMKDPMAFFANLPAMLGMGPAQTAALQPMLNGIGAYVGMVTEDGIGSLIQPGVNWAADGRGQKLFEDGLGTTDATVAQLAASQVGATVPAGTGLDVAMGPDGAGALSSAMDRATMTPEETKTAAIVPPANTYEQPQVNMALAM